MSATTVHGIPRWRQHLQAASQRVQLTQPCALSGRITRATGLILEATGLRIPVGGACRIQVGQSPEAWVDAEVVGFEGDTLYLMPQNDISGLPPGARVVAEAPPVGLAGASSENRGRVVPVGEALLGRVVDGAGRPLDSLGPIRGALAAPLSTQPINPLNRAPITQVLDVGVRAINGLLTVGRGQRMGLFAGSGVGKSTLLGMMARHTRADVIVVGLIGERGREVKDFIDNILGSEGLERSVVVAAPADVTPLLRIQGAVYATRLAEYFRDQGLDVLLIMDSLTRFAMAQREIALAIGEPPATKGYPPSVFARLPALVERAGNGPEDAQGRYGSITAFYTVLTEGDDQQDPIADAARAILDGHIVLSRALADAAHYPAIDIEASISRALTALVEPKQLKLVSRFRHTLSSYMRNRDLIAVGAYTPGADPAVDEAIQMYPAMAHFLQQGLTDNVSYEQSVEQLNALFQSTYAHG